MKKIRKIKRSTLPVRKNVISTSSSKENIGIRLTENQQSILSIFSKISEYIENNDFSIKNTSAINFSSFIQIFSVNQLQQDKPALVILETEKQAKLFLEQVQFNKDLLLKENSKKFNIKNKEIIYFPSWGILPFCYSKPDSEREGLRARTLASLLKSRDIIVVTTIEALIYKTISVSHFKKKNLILKINDSLVISELLKYLTEQGYIRSDIVEVQGQFSLKGSIVDVFCPGEMYPIRIDFFGDDIDSIRKFDPLNQKSIEKIKESIISPRRDLSISKEEIKVLEKKILDLNGDELNVPDFIVNQKDNDNTEQKGLWDLYPLLYETGFITDFFIEEPNLWLYEKTKLLEKVQNLEDSYFFLKEKNKENFSLQLNDLFLKRDFFSKFFKKDAFSFTQLPELENDNSLEIKSLSLYKGKISKIIDTFDQVEYAEKIILISCKTQIQIDRIKHILSAYDCVRFHPSFILAPYEEGFQWHDLILITEYEIFGKKTTGYKVNPQKVKAIDSFTDLREGDYVVHINYGIGIFKRLKRMTAAGHERDFLELEYRGNDKLYVPLEQLNLVHRYIGSSDSTKLDSLGKKSSWEKTKKKAEEEVEKTAQDLLSIYASREKVSGYSFSKDNLLQEEFEAAFEYEETEHQLAAILEVKKDMEADSPMDRLVCGDVGFGKTEVAIRAAFKAVMSGKQIALLCPTTILAFQHYRTFSKRFENYPVQVDFISRFKTPAENKKIKAKLKEGRIDIIIGTHSLLSSTIQYKNLGLLIVDEEQRFGVIHKETIKKIKKSVDCLTLTATPIPRTLHLSLTGLRDLSLIETPPRDRKKIETFVLEDNESILKQAITRELNRHGQVYVLHNKVKTIEAVARMITNLIPIARIAILHGQLPEDDIERISMEFMNYEYDILISTTIIESGIDIPNVNTLLVMNAQNFGLSQLYQLKGRVGRSDRQAYSYFFYPSKNILNEVAEKRLNTLQEYNELGAGFKIAMKDLEIRGAGNILGKQQSGEILTIGFEYYVQMLNEKLHELKNEKNEEFHGQVSINQNFFIPHDYIHDTRQKMEFYKKLAQCESMLALEDFKENMTDRFGQFPEQIQSMVLQEKLRILADVLKFEKIKFINDKKDSFQKPVFELIASHQSKLITDKIIHLITKDNRFQLDNRNPKMIKFYPQGITLLQQLQEITSVLEFV